MNRVILQPVGLGVPWEHYKDTILNPVDLKVVAQYIPENQMNKLRNIYPQDKALIWGVVPGKNNINVGKWDKIQAGDIALFSGQNRIFASAVVTSTLVNSELAANLWDYDDDGQTWEYIYFLDELLNQDIPYKAINKAVGYEERYIIRGLNVLDIEKSKRIINKFDLSSTVHLEDISEEEFTQAVDELEDMDSLEAQGTVQIRREQSYIRKRLFGNQAVFKCGICHREFPVSFIIAAHIKKRANCTLEEKKNVAYIVMPMCNYGCDALYERGYIAIENGKAIDLKKKPNTPSVQQYINEIAGTVCEYWNDNTAPYFRWHFKRHSVME